MKRSRKEIDPKRAFLIERYGKSYVTPSRWKIPAALLALIGIPWLLWSAGFHSTPSLRYELIAFKVIDERSIEITYLLERNEINLPVTCTLVARDFEKNIVGEVTDEFESNDASGRDVQTRTIPTRTRAVNAAVVECYRR
jgi:hypothetical protein